MRKARLLLLGVSIGAAFVFGYTFHAWTTTPDFSRAFAADWPPIDAEALRFDQADVERHRRDHYAEIDGIAGIVELPTDFSRKEALYALAGRADIAALDRYLADAAAIDDATLRPAALTVLFRRYAELDPRQALRVLDSSERLSDPQIRAWSPYEIGHTWAASAPSEAYAFQTEIANREVRRSFLNGVIYRWARDDPEAALQAVMHSPETPETAQLLQSIMHEMGRRNPRDALSLADQQPTVGFRNTAQYAVLEVWAEKDVAAVLQYVESMPESSRKHRLEEAFAHQYAKRNADKAIAWARSMPGRRGEDLLVSVLTTIAQNDAGRAINATLALEDGTARRRAFSSVMANIKRSQPEIAARHVHRLDSGIERGETVAEIARAWSERDQPAAAAWAAGLHEDMRERAFFAIGAQVAEQNPDLATEYIDLLSGHFRSELVGVIARTYAQKDAGQAVAWIAQFEGGPLYASLVGSIAQMIAADSPRSALQLLESIPSSTVKSQAVRSSMYTWASTDPPAAAEYAENMTDSAAKVAAVVSIAASWAAYDAITARNWVSQLRPDDVRDQGFLSLITNTVHSPDDYLLLINEIRAEDLKSDALNQAVQNLAYRDGDAARLLLDRSDATAEQKAALQRVLDDPSNFGGY